MDRQSATDRKTLSRCEAELILASESARRSELLAQICVNFIVESVDVDETPIAHEKPRAYVQRLAMLKAEVGHNRWRSSLPVLGADTIVFADGKILGKPRDKHEALVMLERLSGKCHQVLSAVSIIKDAFKVSRLCTSHVSFRHISAADRERYWKTGEPLGKAGAYAIQGRAAVFIERLEGSYSGVMGLPLYETAQLLAEVGIDPLR